MVSPEDRADNGKANNPNPPKAAYFGAFYPIHPCKALALLHLT